MQLMASHKKPDHFLPAGESDKDLDENWRKKSVLITNIPPGTEIQELIIYFQKHSNGGGEVNDTKMLGDGKAVVVFDEEEVARRVLQREHKFKGTLLQMEACLKPTEGTESCLFLPRYAKPPNPKRRSSANLQNGHQSSNPLLSDSDDEERSLETMALDTEPKLMFIIRRQVDEIEKRCKMKIDWNSEPGKAYLSPKGKDARLFDQGKEEFITLYQKEFQDFQEKDFLIDTVKNIEDIDSTMKALMEEFAVVIERKDDKNIHIFGKENHVTQAMQKLKVKVGKRRGRRAYKDSSNGELPMPNTHAKTAMLPLRKTLENGVVVSVHQGDITKVQVDVIVNAANENLSHGGGFAGAIVKQGGRQIQQESDALVRRYGRFRVGQVAHTGPGNLPYKCILHAIGPQWRVHGEEGSRQFIFEACINSFNLASKHKISSIALPGISSGIYGVPKQICADMMFTAAESFAAEASSDNQLKDIRFVNIDIPTCEAFRREFHYRYGLTKGEDLKVGSNSYQRNVVHPSYNADKEREYRREAYQQSFAAAARTGQRVTVEESERKKRADAQATNQRNDELQKTLETERQAHQATNQRNDELQRTLETERQAHQETRQRNDELQRILETESQAHQATNQRNDELQRTLETERQAHQATNHSKGELQRTLETERQAHQETRQRKERLETSLEQERERNSELLTTQATLQRAVEDYRTSTESCDWVLHRDEVGMTETLIGEGGWGRVIEGNFRGCKVAVKQIHQVILSDHNRRLFEREIGIVSRCRHPCLLQFIGATNDNQSPLLVAELLESSLREILGARPLDPTEIITIALDVARGLNYLHLCRPTPIIHRDISSGNVLLWKHNTSWRAKVSDFGTANFLQQTMTACPGAPVYSAPEAHTSRQSPKVDVYSFGVLLCEMFVRELPDVARREEQVARITNEFFRKLIRRCLHDNPDSRPSMAEILEELETYQN